MSKQITTFTVGSAHLGLDILIVKEVHRHMDVTPIPGSPPHMSGLMNLRGRVVTIVDLAVCLGQKSAVDEASRSLLILKTDSEIVPYVQKGLLEEHDLGNDILGFIIDRMSDVFDIEEDDVLPTPPNLKTVDRKLISGVIKLENKLVLLLDIKAVLDMILSMTTDTNN